MAIELSELSAKICSLHGTHRSQYVAAATTEVLRSITAMLRQPCHQSHEFSNKQYFHLPAGIPAEIVYNISEMCVAHVDDERFKPLVEALLQCNIGATLPGSNKSGLSPAFVSCIRDKGIELSYPSQVALWTKDISAFEHYVLAIVKSVTQNDNKHSDSDIEKLLLKSNLPQACCQQSQLFYHIRDLLKTELLASRGAEIVINFIKTFHKLFRRELTCPQFKQLAPSSLYSYYPSHLHSLLHLTNNTEGYDINQLWSQINDLLNATGNTYNLRTDVWLLLMEFDCWRDCDAERLQLSSHDHKET